MPTTAEQQLALELINQARLDPLGEYDRLVTNATPAVQNALNQFQVDLVELKSQFDAKSAVPALAWNENLATSAQNQNDLMNQYDQQSHFLGDQTPQTFKDRFEDAGYTGFSNLGENIYAYTIDPDFAHAGFYIDWGNTPTGIQTPAGHREAIMSSKFTEVGVSWSASDPGNNIGPFITTQHFGNRFATQPQLLGVVIDDADDDDFYDIGEGMGGVTIEAVGTSGEGTFVTTSWASGGYQMALPTGVFNVTFSGGGMTGPYTVTVTMGTDNLKLDAELDDAAPAPLILVGTSGADTLTGEALNDLISGAAGADILSGGQGDDTINGNNGDDMLAGDEGNDAVFGGGGDDTIYGGEGNDTLTAGVGKDMVVGDDGNDVISGKRGNDNLSGKTGDDDIMGGKGHDRIDGNKGNDVLNGGKGNDRMSGGQDDDTLIGGEGDDILTGGSGADVFVFDTGHDQDTISDLTAIDTIQLSGGLAGNQTEAQIAASANVSSGSAVLDFGGGDMLTLTGFTNLSELEAILDII